MRFALSARFVCHALAAVAVLAAGLASAAPSVAAVTASLTAVDPESPATLGSGQSLYVKVEYESDQPLRVQGQGARGGQTVPGMTNGSPVYPAGRGTALAWIAYRGPETIDEMRVELSDARWQHITTVGVSVQATWTAIPGARDPAPWVRALNDAQQRAISADMNRAVSGPAAMLSGALAMIFVGCVPLYPVLQAFALWRLRGGFRLAASSALFLMLPIYVFCLWALSRDSNLWPVTAIFASPVAVAWLVGVLLVEGLTRRASATR